MKNFFTLTLCFFTLSLTAQETITYPYNPDGDADGVIASPDLLELLEVYGGEFSPSEIQIDGVGLLQVIQGLQNQLSILQGEMVDTLWFCGMPLEYQGYNYSTVQINNQCWFSENLRAQRYLNNDSIPLFPNYGEWSNNWSQGVGSAGGPVSQEDNKYILMEQVKITRTRQYFQRMVQISLNLSLQINLV